MTFVILYSIYSINKDLITQYLTKIEGYHDRSLLLCNIVLISNVYLSNEGMMCRLIEDTLKNRDQISGKCLYFPKKSQNGRIIRPFWDKNGKIMGKIQSFIEIFPVQDLNDQLFSLKRRFFYSILHSLNRTLYTTMDSNIL